MDRTTPPNERSLAETFANHSGNVAFKWQQYIPIYETEFRRFIDEGNPISLLEIGVLNGGSLQIWRDYFPEGSRIYGIDINPACASLQLGERIEVLIGDACDPEIASRLLGDKRFGVVVDDGSHRSDDVVATFAILFERVEYGGIYMIEDCHTSYWDKYGGGYLKPNSTIEWAKTLADAVNYDHIVKNEIPDESTRSRLKALNRDVARVAFYDSVVVIEKHAAPKERPFGTFLVGEHMPVRDPVGRVSLGKVMLGPFLLPKVESSILAELETERGRNAKAATELAASQVRIDQLTKELEARKAELARQAQRSRRLSAKLRRLSTSYTTVVDSIPWRLFGWIPNRRRVRGA
jgi:hypothetical protein